MTPKGSKSALVDPYNEAAVNMAQPRPQHPPLGYTSSSKKPIPAYKLRQRELGMRQTRVLHSHHIRAYAQKTGITAISKAELDAVFAPESK